MDAPSVIGIVLQFAFATLFPVAAGVVLTLLEKRGAFSKIGYVPKQLIIGIIFGCIAIFGTEFGIKTVDATMNVRDAAPLVAGLYFGSPAGIIAGIIGGVERWFAALWGKGEFTRVACSCATIAVGLYAALLNRLLFSDRKPRWQLGLAIGMVAEVLHLLLVFLTNLNEAARALHVVQACSFPMITCNALSVALAGAAIASISGAKSKRSKEVLDISQVIQLGMLVVVGIGFVVTVGFTFVLQQSSTYAQTLDTLSLAITDVEADIREASGSSSDIEKELQLAVANRHVGHDGLLVVLDSEGKMLGARADANMGDNGARIIWNASQQAAAKTRFRTSFNDVPYFAMYEDVDDKRIVALLPVEEANTTRDLSVLVTSFMEVLVFAALFAMMYILIRRVVVGSIWKVNGTLNKITSGDLEAQVDVRSSREFSTLSDDINTTVGALREAIAAEGARIERDLVTAKAIQESALPTIFPPFPDIDKFDIYANMQAAREVGGDFYDFFLIDNHTLGFFIADVSGKGIPASLFMMAAKADLTNFIKSGMELDEAVASANAALCDGNDVDMFATAWIGKLDFETGQLTYVNAGHNPPLLRHGYGGEWEWLSKKGGLFLGTFPNARYRSSSLTLELGDELLLYTDGVNEAFSASEEEFGNERLEHFLALHNDMHPHSLIVTLKKELHRWSQGTEQSDDITMLCLEYGVPPEVTGLLRLKATNDDLEKLRRYVHLELLKVQCPAHVQRKLEHTIEELFSNIVEHGYAGSNEPGEVAYEYTYSSNPHSIVATLTDSGVPFNPIDYVKGTEGDEVTGAGIALALSNLDDAAYIYEDGHNVIGFRIDW